MSEITVLPEVPGVENRGMKTARLLSADSA
jgi:hypothetical protein